MSAQSIRPEFSLIETKVDYTTALGVKIAAGTIIARLFYPAGYVFSNPNAGKSVVYDSWAATGKGFTSNRKTRVIEMVATKKLVEWLSDETRTVPNNMASNRVRTVALANRILKSQVQAIRNTPAPTPAPAVVAPAATQVQWGEGHKDAELERLRRLASSATVTYATIDWVKSVDETEAELIDIVAIAKSRMPVVDNAQSSEPLVTAPAIFASDWTNEELWKCTVKQLKVIGKKLGIKVYGTKAEIIAKIKASH